MDTSNLITIYSLAIKAMIYFGNYFNIIPYKYFICIFISKTYFLGIVAYLLGIEELDCLLNISGLLVKEKHHFYMS